jgi:hypothetical protein
MVGSPPTASGIGSSKIRIESQSMKAPVGKLSSPIITNVGRPIALLELLESQYRRASNLWLGERNLLLMRQAWRCSGPSEPVTLDPIRDPKAAEPANAGVREHGRN